MDEICESSENRSSIYTVLLEERLAYDCAVSGNYEDACLHIQKIVDMPTIGEDKYWYMQLLATVYKGNIIKNLIMDCQSYTKYRPNETTGGIFVSWRRKEELPTGA